MILITVVDDRNGLTFNHRRLSQDRVLRKHILEDSIGSRLWMDTYTAGQFKTLPAHVSVDDTWPSHAGPGEYAFLEKIPERLNVSDIEKIILYKWNRVYPADTFFPVDLEKGWKIIFTEEFPGYSHQKLTVEVWIPCKEK